MMTTLISIVLCFSAVVSLKMALNHKKLERRVVALESEKNESR